MPATRWATSLYEARLFVRGTVNSLGADCIEKPLGDEHKKTLGKLLEEAGLDGQVDPSSSAATARRGSSPFPQG